MPAECRWILLGDEGATAAEYAILASVIVVAIAGTVVLLGTRVVELFGAVPAF